MRGGDYGWGDDKSRTVPRYQALVPDEAMLDRAIRAHYGTAWPPTSFQSMLLMQEQMIKTLQAAFNII